ncbi:DUF3258 domain-containing protein [Oceanicoccus sagamiensis]|nr:DUF3258 domain-containing protein [Oceanicoccus sagamiensis]
MSLSEVFISFLEYKARNGLSIRIQQEYRRYFEVILHLLGDKPVDQVTRKCLKGVIQAYSKMPKRNLGEYRNLGIEELVKVDVPIDHRVAPKTVGQVKKLLHGIFVHAVYELEVVESSPAIDLKVNLKANTTFAAFNDSDIRKLLAVLSNQKKEWHKWVLLLGIYTGARRGELIKLCSRDVKRDEVTGRYYIMITDEYGSVKTEGSIRQVPMHSELLRAGFINFSSSRSGVLFPELKQQQVTSWFMRLRDSLDIPSVDDYGNRKVFHSLRHTFITKARSAGVSVDKVQQVVGHEKKGSGVTDRYTHRFPLGDVLDVVDVIKY